MDTTFIYTLSNPITNEVRYVGKANDLTQRYKNHLKFKVWRKNHKNDWIMSLIKMGIKPKMEVIDIVSIDEWMFWEQYWISQFRSWGFNLVNGTFGGEGSVMVTAESRKRMSEAQKRVYKEGRSGILKRVITDEMRKRQSEYCKEMLIKRPEILINARKEGIKKTKNNPDFKKKVGEITKRLMKENPDAYKSFFNSQKGKMLSSEEKKVRSERLRKYWEENPNQGIPVYQYSLNGVLVRRHDNSFQAEKKYGFSSSHVSSCANGNRKTHKGFIWRKNLI